MLKEFGKLLRAYRENRGLSLDEVLSLLQDKGHEIWAKSTVSKWEKGIHRPKREIVEALEDILGIRKGTLQREFMDLTEIESEHEAFDLIALKRLEEHFEHLAKIAEWLSRGDQGLSGAFLSAWLISSFKVSSEFFGDSDLDCFLSHLKVEYPDLESKEYNEIATEDPVSLLNVLKILVQRGTFKGKCPVCEEWQQDQSR